MIVNKIDELHHYLYNEKCDCVFITETWLSSRHMLPMAYLIHITDSLFYAEIVQLVEVLDWWCMCLC